MGTTKLTDMEELLGTVIDPQVKDYMSEALTCYGVGAHRACIVLCYISLFDHVFRHLEELAKVNKEARRVFTDASKKAEDQQAFETYLMNQLVASRLMPKRDKDFFEILRVLRNKSAHPSGHVPSAEEARFVYAESIRRFLSKPILSTQVLGSVSKPHINRRRA